MKVDPSKHWVDGKYSIRELVDLGELRSLFQSFTDSMGFTIGFLSIPDLEILIATGWRDICTKYHRQCPLAMTRCRMSNDRLIRHLKRPGQIVIEGCENGLVDCATPIIIKGKKIAILATGQVLLKPPDMSYFKRQAKLFGCNGAAYLRAVKEVPVISEKKLKQATRFLGELAHMIIQMGHAGLAEKERAEALGQEIRRREGTEIVLKDTLDQLGALYDGMTDGIIVGDVKTKKLLKVNASACRMFGYSEKEILTKKVRDMHPQQHLKKVFSFFRSLTRKEKLVALDVPCKKRDGAVFFADVAGNKTRFEGRDCLVGFFRDATERKMAAESLRMSAKDWQSTFDAVTDAVWLLGLDGRVLRTNKAASRLFGKKSGEILGHRCCEMVHGTSQPPKECPMLRMRKTLRRESSEIRLEDRWLSITVDPTFDKAGVLNGAVHIVSDITDRKRLDLSLHESEERLRMVLDSSLDLIYRRNLKTGCYDYLSSAVRRHTGYAAHQLVGAKAGRSMFRRIHPEDLPRVRKALLAARFGREAQGILEYRFRHRNGRYRWFSDRFTVVKDETGRPLHWLGVSRDVTEHKKIAGALVESERRYRLLTENSSDVIWTMNLDGKFTYVSPTTYQLRGYTSEEVMRQPLDKQVAPGSLPLAIATLDQVLKKGRRGILVPRRVVDVEQLCKNGSTVWTEVSIELVRDKVNGVLFLLGVTRNITERKRTLEELEKYRGHLEEIVMSRTREVNDARNFLDKIINTMGNPVFVKDRKHRWVLLNDAYCKFMGYRREQLIGKSDRDFFSPGEAKVFWAKDEIVFRTGKANVNEEKFTDARGCTHTVLTKEVLYKEKSGQNYIVGIITDITERERTEHRIRENEEKIRRITNALPSVVYTYQMTPDGKQQLTFLSPQVRKLFGISQRSVLKDFYILWNRVVKEDRKPLYASIRKSFKALTPWEYDFRIITPTGIHKWIHGESVPERPLPDGHVIWHGALSDITARKRMEGELEKHRNHLEELVKARTSALEHEIGDRIHAEEKLRVSEARLQLQFRRMPIGCILWNADFRVLMWNPAAEKIFGYSAHEAIGKHPYGWIVSQEAWKRISRDWSHLRKGEITAHSVNENRTKKGEKILCKWTNTPLRGSDGEVLGVLSMVEDVTALHLAEDHLRESERRYRALFESAKDAIFLMEGDRFIDCNPTTLKMFGCDRKEILGTRPYQFSPERQPDGGSSKEKALEMISAAFQGVPQFFQWQHCRRDGSLFDAEVGLNTMEISGKKYLLAIVRDITERKKSEEALNENRRQLRQIIDTVPHMIFAKDREGRFLIVNRAVGLMYGKDPQSLIGKRRQDVHPVSAEAQKFLDVDREVLSSGKPRLVANEPFTDTKGRHHILQTIKIPFAMAGLKENVVLGVSVDVTEQKKIEEFRNDIIRTVSHELRTPLSIEKGGISLLLDGSTGPINEEQKTVLESVMRNVDRLARMIDSLLNISKIEAGKVELKKKVVDFRDIVREVAFEFKIKAEEKNIAIELDLSEQKVEALADADKIAQVLSNLIDNALKFTRQGSIKISLRRSDGEVECSVQDTGVGIAPENMSNLFEKFQQFAHAAGPGEKGLGLGLSIARGLVDLHGGRIWAKSRPGEGLRVTFSIPVDDGGEEPELENL
ncbi:MAG TPA: PAS domain S-box protein [Candidatus Omnitrophota bacterium]|nr:PAS domain S-box protein [Candidatus Omnitrophota bacterium]HPS36868.1 PAS domain S-box protein [Candidatus Omnitrophota bacterium]